MSGFSPIITTASSQHTAYLKSLGATYVFDRHADLSVLPNEIAKITSIQLRSCMTRFRVPKRRKQLMVCLRQEENWCSFALRSLV